MIFILHMHLLSFDHDKFGSGPESGPAPGSWPGPDKAAAPQRCSYRCCWPWPWSWSQPWTWPKLVIAKISKCNVLSCLASASASYGNIRWPWTVSLAVNCTTCGELLRLSRLRQKVNYSNTTTKCVQPNVWYPLRNMAVVLCRLRLLNMTQHDIANVDAAQLLYHCVVLLRYNKA